jgi:hypothetical protein
MSATRRKQSASATLEPPNLWTTQGERDMQCQSALTKTTELYRPATSLRKAKSA